MKILRIEIIVLLGLMGLAGTTQIMLQVPYQFVLFGTGMIFFASASILGLPILQKRSFLLSAALWLMLYLFLQLVLIVHIAISDAWLLPYTAIEVTLLLLGLGLAYKINEGLQHLDKKASQVISPEVSNIPTINQAESTIHDEITRSRHHERPLALIAFRINQTHTHTSGPLDDFNQGLIYQSQQDLLVRHLRHHMQRYYQLLRDDQNDFFYVVCPELNRAAANNIGQQISESFATQTGIHIHYASASFPEDGFTFNKILKEATKRITAVQPVGDQVQPIKSQGLSA